MPRILNHSANPTQAAVQEISCTIRFGVRIYPSASTPPKRIIGIAVPNAIPEAPSIEFMILIDPEIKSFWSRSRIPFVVLSPLIRSITIPIMIRSSWSANPNLTDNRMIISAINDKIRLYASRFFSRSASQFPAATITIDTITAMIASLISHPKNTANPVPPKIPAA